MEKIDWSQFVRKIYINAPIEKVYKCWATTHKLERWFLRRAEFISSEKHVRANKEFIQSGDSYTWRWHNWDGQESGEIIEANGTNKIVFSFADGKVEVELSRGKGMTLVKLTQSGIGNDDKSKMNQYVGCSNGWTFWLTNLKAYLEHRILLHDKQEDPLDPNDGFQFVNM